MSQGEDIVGVELLPCPFCGGEAERFTAVDWPGFENKQARCRQCSAEAFATKWQTRTLTPEPSAAVDLEGGLRPEVLAFAYLMERQLRANDHKPGWKDDLAEDLFARVKDEVAELERAVFRHDKRMAWGDGWLQEDTVPRVGSEAVDVANFAMMVADVCGALVIPDAAHTNRGEVERLREALEPFAELADNFVGEDEDDDDLYSPPLYEHQMRVRIGWLRAALAARAALSSPDTVKDAQ